MFHLQSPFEPAGDQPRAIEKLTRGLQASRDHQVLLGVTGSGKTYVMAKVIEATGRPALVMTHNKTLAAQLYNEFREFFPAAAVEYFISYYDFYQPEAYLPSTGTYIEKDARINEEIDRLRHRATWAVQERDDFVIVASVSCIYGLGSPDLYRSLQIPLVRGEPLERDALVRRLVETLYERNDYAYARGSFRVRGDVVEIFPPSAETGVRVEFFGDQVEELAEFEPATGKLVQRLQSVSIYPAKHYVAPEEQRGRALASIEAELQEQVTAFKAAGKLLEAQRLQERTAADLEMLRELGHCQGVENYSRHLDGREAGTPPSTLVDYLPPETLIFVDESHQTLPQLQGMVRGDGARKKNLVEFGFRLPSAFDNRPLTYDEFMSRGHQRVYVSATPADTELALARGAVAELIVRPTGLVDPAIEVRPATGQVDDLVKEVRLRVARGQRTLVTTLTKRMAEDLTDYLRELDVKVRYLHHDIHALDRVELLRELRLGTFDVLVGINLLREGLDLPEVSLVAILDADREGFLRSTTSLIQTCGRAARHVEGLVVLYADTPTDSIARAIGECSRRRDIQLAYNREHGITPVGIVKGIAGSIRVADAAPEPGKAGKPSAAELEVLIEDMHKAASELRFEDAARLRDQILDLEAGLKAERGSVGRTAAHDERRRGQPEKGRGRRGGPAKGAPVAAGPSGLHGSVGLPAKKKP